MKVICNKSSKKCFPVCVHKKPHAPVGVCGKKVIECGYRKLKRTICKEIKETP